MVSLTVYTKDIVDRYDRACDGRSRNRLTCSAAGKLDQAKAEEDLDNTFVNKCRKKRVPEGIMGKMIRLAEGTKKSVTQPNRPSFDCSTNFDLRPYLLHRFAQRPLILAKPAEASDPLGIALAPSPVDLSTPHIHPLVTCSGPIIRTPTNLSAA